MVRAQIRKTDLKFLTAVRLRTLANKNKFRGIKLNKRTKLLAKKELKKRKLKIRL